MKEVKTTLRKTYVVTSPNGCTVTVHPDVPALEIPANTQTLVVAQSGMLEISDDAALVTEVGGLAELIYRVESGAEAQSGTGCTCELTAEAIQEVAPIAWGSYSPLYTTNLPWGAIAIGSNSTSSNTGSLALGDSSKANAYCSISIGYNAQSTGRCSIAQGFGARALSSYAISIGGQVDASKDVAITIGTAFTETTDSGNVTHTCTTKGTGSITIGAGANTLNNGDVESSNSVTIGCKASNQGADSVVIGAQASNNAAAGVAIGAGSISKTRGTSIGWGTQSEIGVAVGYKAKADDSTTVGRNSASEFMGVAVGGQVNCKLYSTAVGTQTDCSKAYSCAFGVKARNNASYSISIGANATVFDQGATVIRSTAEDGTYTQLYFSGANTPLANTYHDGAPMLGYVTKDSAGNIVAAGTRSLIDLLTDNSTFQPASLDENGEWVMPRVFHPSDLDLPIEEPSEPEEYTPLPVYPIVEPEIPEEL